MRSSPFRLEGDARASWTKGALCYCSIQCRMAPLVRTAIRVSIDFRIRLNIDVSTRPEVVRETLCVRERYGECETAEQTPAACRRQPPTLSSACGRRCPTTHHRLHCRAPRPACSGWLTVAPPILRRAFAVTQEDAAMQTAEILEAHGKHRYDGRYAKGERHQDD